jgi:hypothetical protein
MKRPNCFLGAALVPMLVLAASARAGLFTFTAAGNISSNSSSSGAAIPIGTPWSFEITYDTDAPDLDFQSVGSPDPTYGVFNNSAAPPALTYFHYKAGTYEVTLDNPSAFGAGSGMTITFTTVNAIDINIFAPGAFPLLGGSPVSFHADFNAFNAAPIFASDGLPTNTALGPGSFDASTVSLLPVAGEISGSNPTSLGLVAVPEPATAALAMAGFLLLMAVPGRTRRSTGR